MTTDEVVLLQQMRL